MYGKGLREAGLEILNHMGISCSLPTVIAAVDRLRTFDCYLFNKFRSVNFDC